MRAKFQGILHICVKHDMSRCHAVGPYEVFSRLSNTTVTFVSSSLGPIRTDTRALALGADATFVDLPAPDIIVVPGGSVGTWAAAKNPALITWVQQAHRMAQWTLSVCTGSLILGAAGLLKGLTATTHWAARDFLGQFGATYVPQRYVQHGTLVTAAGVSAGIDMALFVAGAIAGEAQAQAIQLAIEYDPHPPYPAGSWFQASPETIEEALLGLRKDTRRESGKLIKETMIRPFHSAERWPQDPLVPEIELD